MLNVDQYLSCAAAADCSELHICNIPKKCCECLQPSVVRVMKGGEP